MRVALSVRDLERRMKNVEHERGTNLKSPSRKSAGTTSFSLSLSHPAFLLSADV